MSTNKPLYATQAITCKSETLTHIRLVTSPVMVDRPIKRHREIALQQPHDTDVPARTFRALSPFPNNRRCRQRGTGKHGITGHEPKGPHYDKHYRSQ